MPPKLALFLTLGFIYFLFRRDFREKPNVTGALWLPLLWFLIICSRAVTQWLDVFGVHVGATSVEEGSPVDAFVYYTLISAGIYVLNKRQVRLADVAHNNPWLIAFLLYSCFAILWSDFPFIAFKRWTKIIGHPIMVLIILTEPDPKEALRRLMKRCAYVVVPLSIVLIKYFPTIGRHAGPWATTSMNQGIAQGKNLLGADCMILGFFFFWHLLQTWRIEKGKARRNELLLIAGFLLAICWLFRMAQSSTALMSMIIGVLTIVFLGLRVVNKRLIGAYVVTGVVILLIAEAAFGISGMIIAGLGRDSTLTGRTELWKQVLEFQTNPILGVGCESFWLGERLRKIGELYWWQANEAHNGYIETYLNLGAIGVFLMIGWMIAAFRKSVLEFFSNPEWGRFRLGFLAAAVVYNLAESAFRTLHPVWFVFYIIALDYPTVEDESAQWSLENADTAEEAELSYSEKSV
jgi:exopolysaccharide production protein ExoQ